MLRRMDRIALQLVFDDYVKWFKRVRGFQMVCKRHFLLLRKALPGNGYCGALGPRTRCDVPLCTKTAAHEIYGKIRKI